MKITYTDREEIRAFFDEMDVEYRVVEKGARVGMLELVSAPGKAVNTSAPMVFEAAVLYLERIKREQLRDGNPAGWEFPVYDHVAYFRNRKGENVYTITPYHSSCIFGFMPPWMHLSRNSRYMGELSIWAAEGEIPNSIDPDYLKHLAKLPPLPEWWLDSYENIMELKAFNLGNLEKGGPFAWDMRQLEALRGEI